MSKVTGLPRGLSFAEAVEADTWLFKAMCNHCGWEPFLAYRLGDRDGELQAKGALYQHLHDAHGWGVEGGLSDLGDFTISAWNTGTPHERVEELVISGGPGE